MPRRRAPQPAAGCPVTCNKTRSWLDPPPPAVDRISALSDDLLREIIFLLPTKDGSRTQALASRWRHLWLSAPLNLDCCHLAPSQSSRDVVSAAISRVLAAHPGPVRRLCARRHRHLLYDDDDDALLCPAALDSRLQLQELAGRLLPTSMIFRFSDTLLVMSIADCTLPDGILDGLRFPQLKKLGLRCVTVWSETSLHGFIAGCPVLDFLLLHGGPGFPRLRIDSLSLTRLCVQTDPNTYEISIANAPRLQRVVFLYSVSASVWGHADDVVSTYYAPKVDTLHLLNLREFADQIQRASRDFINRCQHEPSVDSLTAALRTVKSLSISMDLLSLDKVVDLMRLFPCLEKLHVKSGVRVSSNAKHWWRQNWWRRKHRDFIRSHNIRVKKLVLEPYLGTVSHANFATFFLLNARELESMTFQIMDSVYSDGFLGQQHRKLQLDNKVSRGATIHFTTASCLRADFSTKHLHDFDLNDPFIGL